MAGPQLDDISGAPNRPGSYLFSERGTPLYVGQSRNLRRRLRDHTGPTGSHYAATFAFNIAKGTAVKYGIGVDRTRTELQVDEHFVSHFYQAKRRVAAMDIKVVELEDPIERTLLEMLVALALETLEYNSFETH